MSNIAWEGSAKGVSVSERFWASSEVSDGEGGHWIERCEHTKTVFFSLAEANLLAEWIKANEEAWASKITEKAKKDAQEELARLSAHEKQLRKKLEALDD